MPCLFALASQHRCPLYVHQFYEFVVNYVLSVLAAAIVHLAIEAPFASLYRAFAAGRFAWSYIRIAPKSRSGPQRHSKNHSRAHKTGFITRL